MIIACQVRISRRRHAGPDPDHAGSLPRPEDLIALNERRAAGDIPDEAEYLSRLCSAVADVVARQRATGIDLVNDGEYGHSMGVGA
jgi:5-methyltetrahydropteroyltriglutamate--homocysteine methyltransferase